MQIFDYVILIILIIGALFGFIRGAKHRFIKLGSFVFSIVIAYLCYALLANLILTKTDMGFNYASSWGQKIIDSASGDKQNTLITPFSEVSNDYSLLKDAYNSVGIISFFAPFFVSKIFITNSNIATAIASSFVSSIAYAISFVLIFIISYILIRIILNLLLNGKEDGSIGFIDRVLGLIWGLFNSSVFIIIIMLIMVGISQVVPDFNSYLQTQVGFNSNSVSISRVFYNLAWTIINAFK